jgi:hypothetical protein
MMLNEDDSFDFQELQSRVEPIISELYQLLSRNLAEDDALVLLEQLRATLELSEEIDEVLNREKSDKAVMKDVLDDTAVHVNELTAALSLEARREVQHQQRKINLLRMYAQFHHNTCNIHQETLLLKSQELSKAQKIKLQSLNSKFASLHEEKTMNRLLQLKQENDDGEHIINLINKET